MVEVSIYKQGNCSNDRLKAELTEPVSDKAIHIKHKSEQS